MANNKHELINVNLPYDQITVEPNAYFQEILDQTPQVINEAKEILALDPKEVSDDKIADVVRDIDELRRFDRDIDTAFRDLRRIFNQARDRTQDTIKDMMEEANYSQLQDLTEELKVFKETIYNTRRVERWKQVRRYFESGVDSFGDLRVKLPHSTNFKTFQAEHDKLVNASQNWTFNDRVTGAINTYITDLSKDLMTIDALGSSDVQKLYKAYDKNHDLTEVITLNNELIAQKERIKQEAERLAKEKLEREQERLKQEAEAKAKAEAQAQQQKEQAQPPAPKEETPEKDYNASPFQLNVSPKEKTQQVLKNLKAEHTSLSAHSLDPLTAMNYIKQITDAVFSQSPTTQGLIQSPEDYIDSITWILNATKNT